MSWTGTRKRFRKGSILGGGLYNSFCHFCKFLSFLSFLNSRVGRIDGGFFVANLVLGDDNPVWRKGWYGKVIRHWRNRRSRRDSMTFPFAMTICAFLLRSPPWHQPTIVRKHTLCIVDQTIKVLGFIHAPPRADRSGRVSSHQTKAESTHFLLFPRFSRFCAFNTVGGWMAGGRKRSSQQFTQQMKSMVFVSNPIRFPELSRGDILLRHLISRHRKCCGGYLTLQRTRKRFWMKWIRWWRGLL